VLAGLIALFFYEDGANMSLAGVAPFALAAVGCIARGYFLTRRRW
jgi:hypothetical protein